MFFTNYVLHFSCISTIRNGIQMCHFVVYHSEEFNNPMAAFSLGFLIITANVFCAITNMAQSFKQANALNVISNFVRFKLLIQIQDYYLRSKSNFPIKNSVLKEPLVIISDRKKIKSYRMYYVYRFLRGIYTSVYFYFFPLFTIVLPLLRLTLIKWINIE